MLKNFLNRIAAPVANYRAHVAAASEAKRAAAHAILQSSVSELSQGRAKSLSLPPLHLLRVMEATDIEKLSVEQLEDLGRAYIEGVDAEYGQMAKNPERAVEIFTHASDRGSLTASYSLAICQKDGIGMERSQAGAFQRLKGMADDHDYSLGHYGAAVMLQRGEGVAIDHEAAYIHYDRAAQKGVLPAIYNVANYNVNGLSGLPVDESNAYRLYLTAANAGDPAATFTVGSWIYKGRNGLKVDHKVAFTWQKKAADMGHPVAAYNTGHSYMEGEGTQQNIESAIFYFKRAAEGGIPAAAINLGNIYRDGLLGTKVDLVKAREIFQRFARYDNECAEMAKNVDEEIAYNKEQKQNEIA